MPNRRASGINKYTATSGRHLSFRNAVHRWLQSHGQWKTGQQIMEAFKSGEIRRTDGGRYSQKQIPIRNSDVSQRLRRDSRFVKRYVLAYNPSSASLVNTSGKPTHTEIRSGRQQIIEWRVVDEE